jgi:phage baseplate assembly protein W
VTDPLATRIGRDWAFPPAPAPTRTLGLVGGAAVIRQSIRLILATEPGERLMRPQFGCGLRQFLMAPNTPGTRAAIGRAVQGALVRWEPRITVRGVDVNAGEDPAVAIVVIAYTHLRDGSPATVGAAVPVGIGAR